MNKSILVTGGTGYVGSHTCVALFNAGYVVPPIMLNAAKGLGKTAFAKEFHVATKKGERKFIEINCGSIRNSEQFFEQVFMPQIAGKEVTVLFDECHSLPKDLTDVFLTAFNVEGAKEKSVSVGDGFVTFEFTKQIYLFATLPQSQHSRVFNFL